MAEAIANAGLEVADIDWLLLHQANIRIMEHVAREMGISMDKVLRNIDEYGNTSAGEWHRVCVLTGLLGLLDVVGDVVGIVSLCGWFVLLPQTVLMPAVVAAVVWNYYCLR